MQVAQTGKSTESCLFDCPTHTYIIREYLIIFVIGTAIYLFLIIFVEENTTTSVPFDLA